MNDADHMDQLRIPPMSIEAEQAVLGGLMLAPSALDLISDIVADRDFYRRDHQLIFQAITELAERNRPYDAVTLGEWFESTGQAELVAGGAYLIELASTTPSAANITAYAQIVRDKRRLRDLIEAGTAMVNNGFIPAGRETDEIMAEAEANVMALNAGVLNDVEDGEDVLRRTVKELARRRAAGRGALLGVTTGIDLLDELTLGLQATDLVILAARPSMGKTAMMKHMEKAAAQAGMRPYTIEMEMSAEQLTMREIAAVGRVDYKHVLRPAYASDDEMERIRRAVQTMRGWTRWVDATPSMTVRQAAARIRRMKRRHKIDIAFIDYLQFFDLGPAKNGINAAVQDVTRTLKALAKELKIPIVLLSQLNRALESRSDKRPILADLRESGAIEQDADVVMFLHRQGYYERDWSRDDPRQAIAEVIVAKQRNGEIGTVSVNWQGRYQLFSNMSYDALPANWNERKKGAGFEPQRLHGLVGEAPPDDD